MSQCVKPEGLCLFKPVTSLGDETPSVTPTPNCPTF